MRTEKIEISLRAIAAIGLALALACGGGGSQEPAPADTNVPVDETPTVADSLIEQEVQSRIDADPRLDIDGVSITASSQDQVVTLAGEIPSRLELSIAREVAMSVLGVRGVLSDSLHVASESP
ncbi:MAG: BON domain-containing protein [Gemmatimonadota bacterium]